MTLEIGENLLFYQELLQYLSDYDRFLLDHLELKEKISICYSHFMESSSSEIPFIDTLSNLFIIHDHKITDSFLADLKDLLSEELESGQFGIFVKIGPFTLHQYDRALKLCNKEQVSLIAFVANTFDVESYTAWTLDPRFIFDNRMVLY